MCLNLHLVQRVLQRARDLEESAVILQASSLSSIVLALPKQGFSQPAMLQKFLPSPNFSWLHWVVGRCVLFICKEFCVLPFGTFMVPLKKSD